MAHVGAALFLVLFALAGCAQPPRPDSPRAPGANAPPPRHVVVKKPRHLIVKKKGAKGARRWGGYMSAPLKQVMAPLPSAATLALDSRVLTLYFATTRNIERQKSDFTVVDGRSAALTFGATQVRVPEGHEEGSVERPRNIGLLGWTIYRQQADESRHFVIKAKKWMSQTEFLNALGNARRTSAMVFVHGFNTTFDEGMYRLAQIVWDAKYRGVPILFSWPSRGGVLNYLYDRESAEFSRPGFVQLMRLLQDDAQLSEIHIVAHSMGNQVVLDALVNASNPPLLPLRSLVMAAPDVDRNIFESVLAARLATVARGVTLYASSNDKAMTVSKEAAGGARAGDVLPDPMGPVVADRIDTIDVSALGTEMFGLNHTTFAATPTLIKDLGLLIGGVSDPPKVRTPSLLAVPQIGATRYWRYPSP
jgi:esterase/lipase superfamily enzyme